VSEDAWRVIQIAETARSQGVRITLQDVVNALRGIGAKTKLHNLTEISGTSALSSKVCFVAKFLCINLI
jgi:hypothetical protein